MQKTMVAEDLYLNEGETVKLVLSDEALKRDYPEIKAAFKGKTRVVGIPTRFTFVVDEEIHEIAGPTLYAIVVSD